MSLHALPPGYRLVGDTAIREETLPDETPEGVLLGRVRALAKAHGFLTYHTYRSTRSETGFPDVVLTNGVSLIFAELKTNTGKLTPAQGQWLSLLDHTETVETFIWRPMNWADIVTRLTRRSP